MRHVINAESRKSDIARIYSMCVYIYIYIDIYTPACTYITYVLTLLTLILLYQGKVHNRPVRCDLEGSNGLWSKALSFGAHRLVPCKRSST